MFVLLSTVIFSAPPIMCVTAIRTFYNIGKPILLIVFFLGCILMLFITYKYLKKDFNYILEYCESRRFWLFCLIPILFYVYSYAITKYNFIQPSPESGFWVRQIPVIIVFASYNLLVRVFRDTRENRRLHEEQNLAFIELNAMQRYLDELRISQEKSIVYRHDMRHHLLLLSNLAANGEIEKIKDYLADVKADIDAISPSRFCENEMVNLILSAFTARSQKENVELSIEAVLPKEIAMSETELCTLLSNALENAITAAKQLPDEHKRTVRFVCKTEDSKLILLVQNPCFKEVKFENGLPKAEQEGHGFGVKSMMAIVEKYHGLCTFTQRNGLFILRIILPLQ